MLFAVIYRFTLKPTQEHAYQAHWQVVTDYFIGHCGAVGSCLHRGESGLWIAYSRWPDRATREAAWPANGQIPAHFPEQVRTAIAGMQVIKEANTDLPQYPEICSILVADKLGGIF